MKRILRVAVVIFWTATYVIPANSQTEGASVSGTIADSSGVLIPGVTVSVRKMDTPATLSYFFARVADKAGRYSFAYLEPGTWVISASLTGLRSESVKKSLAIGLAMHLDFTMKVDHPLEDEGPILVRPRGNRPYR